MAKFTVVLTGDIHPSPKAALQAVAEVLVCPATDPDGLSAAVADADALLVRHLLPADILEHGPKIRIMARHGVGLDFIPVAEATKKNVIVTNAPGSNTQAVAEHVIGTMLLLARRFGTLDAAVRSGNWAFRNSFSGMELSGRTLGVLGLGKIGLSVAKACAAAFNMRVLGHDPFLSSFPDAVTPATVEQIFSQSDIVTLHVPLTETTREMVDAAMLARMKPGALLINACRGEVVNERDLVAALRSGPLAGAALDVFPEEPLPKEHPYCKIENVILTPHSAALTEESMIRMGGMAADDIVRVLNGERPHHFVNPEVWPAFAARHGIPCS